MTHRQGQFPYIFPTPETEAENLAIVVSDIGHRADFSVLVTKVIPDLHLLAASDAFQCFPLYTYAVAGEIRRDNITTGR
jgi:predicted helicase